MSARLGYARISTDKQDLEGQRQRLEAAGIDRLFTDIMTGKRFDRPGLQRLLEYARPGDTIVFVRFDRATRSLKDLLELVDGLREREINFISLDDNIDTDSPGGEFQLHLLGALAQFERRVIAQRTRDGLAAARAAGRKGGRPPADADAVKAAMRLVDAGMPVAKAAKRAGIGRSTLYTAIAEARAERDGRMAA